MYCIYYMGYQTNNKLTYQREIMSNSCHLLFCAWFGVDCVSRATDEGFRGSLREIGADRTLVQRQTYLWAADMKFSVNIDVFTSAYYQSRYSLPPSSIEHELCCWIRARGASHPMSSKTSQSTSSSATWSNDVCLSQWNLKPNVDRWTWVFFFLCWEETHSSPFDLVSLPIPNTSLLGRASRLRFPCYTNMLPCGRQLSAAVQKCWLRVCTAAHTPDLWCMCLFISRLDEAVLGYPSHEEDSKPILVHDNRFPCETQISNLQARVN